MAQLPDADPQLTGGPDRPTPYVFKCDISAVRKSGGSDLVVIIASPLGDDERSLKKLEMYLRFVSSVEFRAESGTATAEDIWGRIPQLQFSSLISRNGERSDRPTR